MGGAEVNKAVFERMLYGAIIFASAKLVQSGAMTVEMQAYVAAGGVTFLGSFYAWWNNRPSKLLDRAASQLPASSTLVITTNQNAPPADKSAAHELAAGAGENVIATVK